MSESDKNPEKKKLICKHCKYVWSPYKKEPKACPACKRYNYLKGGNEYSRSKNGVHKK